jgi:hypothetical protein
LWILMYQEKARLLAGLAMPSDERPILWRRVGHSALYTKARQISQNSSKHRVGRGKRRKMFVYGFIRETSLDAPDAWSCNKQT